MLVNQMNRTSERKRILFFYVSLFKLRPVFVLINNCVLFLLFYFGLVVFCLVVCFFVVVFVLIFVVVVVVCHC